MMSFHLRQFNPRWIASKIYLWGRSLSKLRSDDIIFAFHPKTGSTWVRIFFYNLFNGENSEFTFTDVNKTMPEFGNPSFLDSRYFTNIPKIIKTHRNYFWFFKRNKKVLFVREPRDTMYSYLHYARAKKVFDFHGDLNDLVRSKNFGLEYYMKFYSSWIPKADLIIKYEDLISDPENTFYSIVKYLNLPFSKEEVSIAVEKSTLDKTRNAQKNSSSYFEKGFKKDFVFARKGEPGEGEKYFDESLEKYYTDLRSKYGFSLYELTNQ
jgi:hypothetical protein